MKVAWLTLILALNAFGDFSNPPLLSYATYLGGAYGSGAQGLAVDSFGYAYVSGLALSPDFPFTAPPPVPNQPGSHYRFLTKLNPQGTGIVWSICPNFPSSGPIALDGSGSIYVLGTGVDSSTVTKLTPNGDKILYSVTLPRTVAEAMAVDPGGNVYLTGMASELVTTCLATPCGSGFVIKLNKTAAVEYATNLPFPTTTYPQAIAVDSRGAAWITGWRSPPVIPPGSWGGDGTPGAFVAKLDAAGAKCLYAASFGGGRNRAGSEGMGVAVDSHDAAYVVGQGDVAPTTPGSLQPTTGFPQPQWPSSPTEKVGFVIKYAPTGEIVYGTFVGGQGSISSVSSVAVDAQGNAYFGVNASVYGAEP